MERLRSPVVADVVADASESVFVADVAAPAPLYLVTEELPVAAGPLALAVVRASAGGVDSLVAVA
jgi:hypothetical protein